MIQPAFDTSYCLVNAQELFRAKEPEIPWCLQPEEKWLAQLPRTLNETDVYPYVTVYGMARAPVAQDSINGFQISFVVKFYLIKWRGGITNNEILEDGQSIHFEAIHTEA